MITPYFSLVQNKKKQNLKILHFFLFYLGFHIVNELIVARIGDTYDKGLFYPLALICIAIGYMIFPMVDKMSKKETTRQTIFVFISFLFLILYVVVVMDSHSLFSLFCCFALTITYGYIGGSIHYSTALALSGNPFAGRIIGVVTCLAVIFKYFIKQADGLHLIFHLCIVSLIVLSLYLAFRPVYNSFSENTLIHTKPKLHSYIAIELKVSTILMLLIISLNFSIISRESFEMRAIPFSTQIFFAFGLLCAGILADIKNRLHITAITSYALIFMTIMVTASTFPELAAVRYFILFFFLGFYVVYMFVAFLDLTPTTSFPFSPPLFSSLGIITQCIGAAILIFLFDIWNPSQTTLILTCSILLAFSTLFLFLIGNNISRQADPQPMKTAVDLPEETYIQKFIEKNNFTERESEVFVILVTTEKTVQEVADDLFISRRVLQRYISSIYKKTDTKTRVGLLQLYHSSKEL